MAVIPMWQVDRDQSMHTNKADADKHDLMLNIGEKFTEALRAAAPSMSQVDAEAAGLFFARHRDAMVKLCKGNVDALDEAVLGLSSEGAVTPPLRAVN